MSAVEKQYKSRQIWVELKNSWLLGREKQPYSKESSVAERVASGHAKQATRVRSRVLAITFALSLACLCDLLWA